MVEVSRLLPGPYKSVLYNFRTQSYYTPLHAVSLNVSYTSQHTRSRNRYGDLPASLFIIIMVVLNCRPPHSWRLSVPVPVGDGSSTSRRIQFCRWIWTYFLNVFRHGDGRGQDDGRELESGCGRDPYICASLSSTLVLHIDSIIIDRIILSCCRIVDLSLNTGYSTKPTGLLNFYLGWRESRRCSRGRSWTCRVGSVEYLESTLRSTMQQRQRMNWSTTIELV